MNNTRANFGTTQDNVFSTAGSSKEDGIPTIFSRIVFKDGKYVATGIDPYFDCLMEGRIKWMTDTNGGRHISPDDHSIYAHEAALCGLPSRDIVRGNQWNCDSNFDFKFSQFAWLGESCNLNYMGVEDQHCCAACNLVLSKFVPGDTFLSQHAYFSRGECTYLKERFKKGVHCTSKRNHSPRCMETTRSEINKQDICDSGYTGVVISVRTIAR